MNIVYKNQVPDKQQFFQLFLTTGWNEEYKLDQDQLYQAINASWFQVSPWSSLFQIPEPST